MQFATQCLGQSMQSRGSDLGYVQVGPLPIGPNSTLVEQYPDGHIPWVKRPTDDLGDSAAMVCPSLSHHICVYQTMH